MANRRTRRGKTDGEGVEAAEERDVTQRVVLKRERVLVLPVNFDPAADKTKEAMRLLGVRTPDHAWVAVGEFEGQSKDDAIEAFAGKPGTADAKVGVFKAPSVRSWKGGLVYDAPPLPLVEKRALEE